MGEVLVLNAVVDGCVSRTRRGKLTTYVASDVVQDVRLQRHVHVHCSHDVAQPSLGHFQYSRYKNRVAYSLNNMRAMSYEGEHVNAPATSFHSRLAFSSTKGRSNRSRTKYKFAYWCL